MKTPRLNGPIIGGRPTPRANAQACIFRSLTATSTEAGKIAVSGSFFCYKDITEFGVEYKKSSATSWTKKKDSSSTPGTVSLNLTSLEAGTAYDVVMYFIMADIKYQFGDIASCTVAEPEPEPEVTE